MTKELSPKEQQKPLIQSLDRALDILELIGSESKPMRSIDIAETLKLKVNTTNNLLRVLYQRGYLSQSDNRCYFLGVKCWELGSKADRWSVLREVASSVMQELAAVSGDLTFLGILDNSKLICVKQVSGSGVITITDRYAWTTQAHCSGSGKVLLSALSDADKELYHSQGNKKSFTDKTIYSVDRLEKELELTKKRGFSLCKDEAAEGVSAIGVPVYYKGKCIASLAQSFPSYFLTNEEFDLSTRIELLHNFSRRITTALNDNLKKKD